MGRAGAAPGSGGGIGGAHHRKDDGHSARLTTFRGRSLEDDFTNRHQVVAGRKNAQSLNHLLGFTLPAREHPGPLSQVGQRAIPGRRAGTLSSHRSSYAQTRFVKERFVNANYRFIVKPTEDYTPYFADPDIFLEWKNILQVIIKTDPSLDLPLDESSTIPSTTEQSTSESGKPNCPICLSTPQAARMTKCGHVFCFPCVLHYLQLSENGAKWRQCPICHDSIYAKDLKSVKWCDKSTVSKEKLELSLDSRMDDEPVPSTMPAQRSQLMTFRLVERPQLTTLALPKSPFWPPSSDSRGNSVAKFTSIHSAPWFFVPDVFTFARFMQATPAYMKNELEQDLVELAEERLVLLTLGERLKRARAAELKRQASTQATLPSATPVPPHQRPFASAAYSAIRMGDSASTSGSSSPSAVSTSRPIPGGALIPPSPVSNQSATLSAEASNDMSIMFVDSAMSKVQEQLAKVDTMKTQGVMTGRKIAEQAVKEILHIEREKERSAILAGTQDILDEGGARHFDAMTTTSTDFGSSTNATTTSAFETDKSGDSETLASTSLPHEQGPAEWLAIRDRASGSLGSNVTRETNLMVPMSRRPKKNVNPPAADAESFLFYQASSGSHVYLHPLEIKILKNHFGSYRAFPLKIAVKVEHSDESTMNDDLRRRCKYLSHLPSGCDVTFVEVDLSTMLGSKAVEPYAQAIRQRRQRRLDKSRREEKARRDALKRDQDKVLESVPTVVYSASSNRHESVSSNHPSPLSGSWQAAMEAALVQSSFTDSSAIKSMTQNASLSPNLVATSSRQNLDDSNEFPKIAITPPKEIPSASTHGHSSTIDSAFKRTVWGTKAVEASLEERTRDRLSLDDDHDGVFAVDDGWLKHIEDEEVSSQSQNGFKGKKTKKKLVLMSNGGRRG